MKPSDQITDYCEEVQNGTFMFSDQSTDDRREEEKENEEEPATMDDWGEVDPAGGPAPTAPGSAV